MCCSTLTNQVKNSFENDKTRRRFHGQNLQAFKKKINHSELEASGSFVAPVSARQQVQIKTLAPSTMLGSGAPVP